MNIINKILEFFGFGGSGDDSRVFHRELEEISSQKRQDLAKQQAFQAIQKGDEIYPDRPHPYEATIRLDCMGVDTLCTQFHTEKLKDSFGDAQYLAVLLQAGLQSEMSQASQREIEGKIRSTISQNHAQANLILDAYKKAEKDLEIFKGANGISYAAFYPEKSNALYLLVAIGIIEAIFNAWFLRSGINLITSLLIAISVAIINIGGNVWLGSRYRNKNHIRPDIAKEGRMNRIYSFALIIFINGLIAGYRFWYASDTDALTAQFTLESTILFIVGIAMGVAAFNKGYALDDPYPEYGAYTRRLEVCTQELAEIRKIHSEYCSDLKRKADSILDALDNRILAASERFSAQLPEMSQLLSAWESDRSKVNYAYKQLQEIFKITISAHHPNGNRGYPLEKVDLPENEQLKSHKEQVERYLNRREELTQQVNKLRDEVRSQRDALHVWWQEPATLDLLGFPK
jgi:hypothetical protein